MDNQNSISFRENSSLQQAVEAARNGGVGRSYDRIA
jgi:hypothetical protein